MMIEFVVFVALVALVLVNLGVQLYIHFEAYPLIPVVGKNEFKNYLTEYENRLALPLLAPYALTILLNIVAIFLRPDGLDAVGIIVVLLLNLSVAPVSIFVATPVYTSIKEAGSADPATFARLMNINLIRLAISALSALAILYQLLLLLDK